MRNFQFLPCIIIIATLAACGKNDDKSAAPAPASTSAPAPTAPVQSAVAPPSNTDANSYKYSVADGYDICLRKAAEKLGSGAKVASITGYFADGKDFSPNDPAHTPEGALTRCVAMYQNPQDARKLLEIDMDAKTGAFSDPNPVEISSSDPTHFNLEDYLITLDKINFAGIKTFIDSQSAVTSGKYSKVIWDRVTLEEPNAFHDTHVIRLDYRARLASNDLKTSGYANLSLDGKKVLQAPQF